MKRWLCWCLALGAVAGTGLVQSTQASAGEPVWLTEESLDQINAGGRVVRAERVEVLSFSWLDDDTWFSDTWFTDRDAKKKNKDKKKSNTATSRISVSINGKAYTKVCSGSCAVIYKNGKIQSYGK